MTTSLSGLVTIENIQYRNRAILPNDNDAEQLVCVVPGPEDSDLQVWEVIPSTSNRYEIKSHKFKQTAYAEYAYEHQRLVARSKVSFWWSIQPAATYGPDTYFIRHYVESNLCWHLNDGTHNTPICLKDFAQDRQSIWKIIPYSLSCISGNATQAIQASRPSITPPISASMTEPLEMFNSTMDVYSEVCPSTAVALKLLRCASEMIVDCSSIEASNVHISRLLGKIKVVYGLLLERRSSIVKSDMEEVLVRLARQMLECADFVAYYPEKVAFWMKHKKHIDRETRGEVQRFNLVLDRLIDCVQRGSADVNSIRIHRSVLDVDLSQLEYVTGAGLNGSKQCLPGTRTEISTMLKDFVYANGADAKRIFWLNGMAGKGKSAIAHTTAEWFEARGGLGSFFCFDRTRTADGRHKKIWTTIARDLANHDPLFRRELAHVLDDPNGLRNTEYSAQQWTGLRDVLNKVTSTIMDVPVLIVIDALDESGDEDTRREILQLLSGRRGTIANLPPNVRIVITSRPLPDIRHGLDKVPHVQHFSLDDILPESDMKKYIDAELNRPGAFGEDDITEFARKSDGVFEWTRLACLYIREGALLYKDRFRTVISGTSAKGTQLLDHMYRLTLEDTLPKDDRVNGIVVFCSVMGQIVASAEPPSISTLAAMRQHLTWEGTAGAALQSISARDVVEHLGALLTGVTDNCTPIRPLHASFYDFLGDKTRSGEFYVGELSTHHRKLAFACLGVMNAELRFNICKLKSSYVPNSDVADMPQRIKKFISSQLNYSCRFWTFHVLATPIEQALADKLWRFFEESVLFWLEVLSLTQSLSGPASALYSISCMFTSVWDAQTGVQSLPAFDGHTGGVLSVAFSPDGRHIVSGSRDNTIRVWDAQAGAQLLPAFDGHTSWVTSVAFSPDGRYIVSGSFGGTIRVWDAQTGVQPLPAFKGHTRSDKTIRVWDAQTSAQSLPAFEGHTRGVNSVAFSPDGQYIVSGSEDNTIRVWDVQTGVQPLPAFDGHTSSVLSVAFSPDGRHIVSGSLDKTIRVGMRRRACNRSLLSTVIRTGSTLLYSRLMDNTLCPDLRTTQSVCGMRRWGCDPVLLSKDIQATSRLFQPHLIPHSQRLHPGQRHWIHAIHIIVSLIIVSLHLVI
ncbi:uncharacterized protein FIBRA_07810 [Fibroporia radiculosa]|uniref:Nephrocystin 3-like N-terminal domain-containing protein n=1 Tax=Fibroporia radiculosa TaxID=599839 RepID=J4I1F0_9APHY|nr:uncharacterized protein FIBRA_07810 [Fibroporia radiculosa]CCM05582.1 predicted protein [Fibroporia radiculosa]